MNRLLRESESSIFENIPESWPMETQKKVFSEKIFGRWKEWMRVTDIKMDLLEVERRALIRNSLMWPLARVVFHHGPLGEDAKLNMTVFQRREQCSIKGQVMNSN